MTSTTELATTYDPTRVEPQILDRWEKAGAFHAEPGDSGDPYCIVIPPPNVTAALHMGHALNNTLQDVIVRWRRMKGDNTLWMPGTDHAGIATQTIVEKRVFEEEGRRRTDFERDQFVARIRAWKDEYEAQITRQLEAMACSCDWQRQRFTMDSVCARAVREAFFRLFKDDLIYRGKRLVNWDPTTRTALADDEVEMKEVEGSFWYLRYPLVENDAATKRRNNAGKIEYVTVATTRPETMLGDMAVAVNPRDPRATALRGRMVRLPIVNRIVPIIEDDYVVLPDPNGEEKARYSSGFLKVTPAHDFNDYEIGRRFNLNMINIFASDGTISRDHGWPKEDFARSEASFLLGMDRDAARNAVVKWFRENDLLEDVKPYRHSVGHSYRSHVPIEPYLSDQWYVKVTDDRLAGAALKAMAQDQRTESGGPVWRNDETTKRRSDEKNGIESWEGKLRFTPPRYARTFQLWHENIRDWCISRQLWWGHRIPVWSQDLPLPDDVSMTPSDSGLDTQIRVALDNAVGGHFDDTMRQKFPGVHYQLRCEEDPPRPGWVRTHLCLKEDEEPCASWLEGCGWKQDSDVLDTWFSSGLWPISTMGWPDEENNDVLRTWNPGNLLCTAREIITLWVSRMVMFNLYLRDCLPFTDVFIHAMIQDGEGQKMSKSLGNGVDPLDIIHRHGADAMRFTLASMTTQTQDLRMSVDLVCPHTGETFAPQQITTPNGYRVAAPIQDCPHNPEKKMVSSFGLASGKATPTDDMPLARNTSEKFDVGRNFANKLWNAARFAISKVAESRDGAASSSCASRPPTRPLPDRWILSRLTRAVGNANASLQALEFSQYAQSLYDFFWRDFCDWYIEAVKPTVSDDSDQRQILATCLDVSLRLLHPVMPVVTEKLWEHLNEFVPNRRIDGVQIPPNELLVRAAWPAVDENLLNEEAERDFASLQAHVAAIREIRTGHRIPQRQTVKYSVEASGDEVERLNRKNPFIKTLANAELGLVTVKLPGKLSDFTLVGTARVEGHLVGVYGGQCSGVDSSAERGRLSKRLKQIRSNIATLEGRLSNKGYADKAPPRLVQQTRNQLDEAKQMARALEEQLSVVSQP